MNKNVNLHGSYFCIILIFKGCRRNQLIVCQAKLINLIMQLQKAPPFPHPPKMIFLLLSIEVLQNTLQYQGQCFSEFAQCLSEFLARTGALIVIVCYYSSEQVCEILSISAPIYWVMSIYVSIYSFFNFLIFFNFSISSISSFSFFSITSISYISSSSSSSSSSSFSSQKNFFFFLDSFYQSVPPEFPQSLFFIMIRNKYQEKQNNLRKLLKD